MCLGFRLRSFEHQSSWPSKEHVVHMGVADASGPLCKLLRMRAENVGFRCRLVRLRTLRRLYAGGGLDNSDKNILGRYMMK